ncbi:MAG: hypothetical protein JXN65_06800 [Clostridia bacterium]|nr:hypothetical protein [Clostridia bacterium]
MSIKLEEKTEDMARDTKFPDNIEELNKLMDSLYEKISLLEGNISARSEDLTEFFQSNIRQNRISYIREDDEIYAKAKNVDTLVNEYNNACIMIELIEKKIKNLESKTVL